MSNVNPHNARRLAVELSADRSVRQAGKHSCPWCRAIKRRSAQSLVLDLEQEMSSYRDEIRFAMLARAETLHREAERLERTEKLIGLG